MVKMVKTLGEVPPGWFYESAFQRGAVLKHAPLPEPTPWYVPPPIPNNICASTAEEIKYLLRKELA